MKILHISTTREWRGGDKELLTIIKILRIHSDLEHVVLGAEDSVLVQKCKELGIANFSASRLSKFSVPFLKKIISLVRNEKIDVVHVHDSNAFSLTLLALKMSPEVKLVYSRKRNNKMKVSFFKKWKYNNPYITRIICVSQAVKEVLLHVLEDPNKAEVIYDGIDIEKFDTTQNTNILRNLYQIDNDTLIIGNIASLTKQKDLFTFLDTVKIILNRSTKKLCFIITGEGPLKEQLEERAASLGISKSVIFTGFRKDVHAILPEFDIFLLSSETEGLPLSVLEAFACKVPVVSTAAGGTGEAVINRVTGMISPIKDPQKLALHTEELITDVILREKLRENAFELVSTNFSLEVMRENYYNFYKSL